MSERRDALLRERLLAVGQMFLDGVDRREHSLKDSRLHSDGLRQGDNQFEAVARVEVALTVPHLCHAIPELLQVKAEGFDLGGNVHRITVSVEFVGG